MGWKKEFKKLKKEQNIKKSIFDYSDGVTSFILWERSFETESFWDVNNLVQIIDKYNDAIEELTRFQDLPEDYAHGFEWQFARPSFRETFFAYPCASDFKGLYQNLLPVVGNFTATLIVASVVKFCYFTTEKFWKVMNYTFSAVQKQLIPVYRIYDVMQRTCTDAIEGIVEKNLLLCNKTEVIPYKNHLLIEEMIDVGDEFTFHWSKMLDQVIELTTETIRFEETYGGSSSSQEYHYNTTNDYDDFFEKTKTMVLNDEIDDAFDYFEISKLSTLDNFKKVYRKFAKKYHPDVNPEPSAAIEMKKINVYKNVVEKYILENNG
ncbi:hypothetical protein SCLARK_001653 [Spiroplasma clarkii]|uniref:J domain-containing protein n=1 Tax=Spiroplasma clarkii TaxID=2139 RepID=A0A1Y0L277_9MOLU|nr:DnaJ domain-containing protein [Spiroplasma clarkii]ARU92121.1 hypothetical protein SCLARK_001653 [Spiroplasma clarkii]ATX71459.1 hypothetical protein SCLAR_v1c11590 [Spiroplasma clarkii]